ncbi:MAG TPA: hypothetical protein VJ044_01820, partial [Candidatus Hodarchaeales archaeon]|nr:hypothetical protein [Candidatus Hodarchaeales archaeon]
ENRVELSSLQVHESFNADQIREPEGLARRTGEEIIQGRKADKHDISTSILVEQSTKKEFVSGKTSGKLLPDLPTSSTANPFFKLRASGAVGIRYLCPECRTSYAHHECLPGLACPECHVETTIGRQSNLHD